MHEIIRRPALYVVATPIGNLRDITLRALDVLQAVDLIAAEDTRLTGRLLAHFAVDKPLASLHQHNERRASERVVEALRAGQAVALTTDAGTPAISDPGAMLVAAARAAGFDAIPIPGPCALTAAWSVSGLAANGFLFHGFLPQRAAERRKVLASVAKLTYASIFYEAPHRIVETAADLVDQFGGERNVVVAREITKMFETIHVSTLAELPAWLAADANRRRGEFVLIVAGAAVSASAQDEHGERVLRTLIAELPAAQAARLAAHISGAPRKSLYDLAVKLRFASRPDE